MAFKNTEHLLNVQYFLALIKHFIGDLLIKIIILYYIILYYIIL